MFWRRADPKEQARVLGLLISYEEAKAEINGALHTMTTEHFTDIQPDEFEEARKSALTTISKVQAEINDPSFWPVLNDNKGSRILLEFRSEFAEYCRHTLTFLRLLRAEAEALKAGKGEGAYKQEFEEHARASSHVADQLDVALTKLLRHYKFNKWTPEDYRSIKDLIKDFESRTNDFVDAWMKEMKEKGLV